MQHLREIILDTETTGLETAFGHRIVEIGAVEMINKVKTGNVFQRYVNPMRDVPNESFQIHGISTQFLKDKPLFKDIVVDLIAFIGDSKLVIHNAPFDIKFLNHEFTLARIPSLDLTGCIDTLAMARKLFAGSKVNLNALCNRFKIDISDRQYHGALKDALLLADVYVELCGGRQSKFNLGTTSGNRHTKDYLAKQSDNIKTPIIEPTAIELKKHKEFIEKFITN